MIEELKEVEVEEAVAELEAAIVELRAMIEGSDTMKTFSLKEFLCLARLYQELKEKTERERMRGNERKSEDIFDEK